MSKEFLKAIFEHRTEEAKKFLRDPNFDVNCAIPSKSFGTMSALELAAFIGEIEILSLLLKHPRIKFGEAERTQRTPLYFAVEQNQLEACKLLLPYCYSLAETDDYKIPYCLAKDRIYLAKTSSEREKATQIADLLRNSTYYAACAAGYLSIVKQVVADGNVNINYIGDFGNALMAAALFCREGVVDYLLTLPGIDIHYADSSSMSILQRLAESNCEVINKQIIHHFNYYSGDQPTEAASIAKKLIKKGVDIDYRNSFGMTAISRAVSFKRLDLVKVYAENNANLEFKYSLPHHHSGEETDSLQLAYFSSREIYSYLKEFISNKKDHAFDSSKKYINTFLENRPKPKGQGSYDFFAQENVNVFN